MIKFDYVEYRNFLSAGDVGIRIDLNRSPTSLITAPNGSGKSTIIDAISFVLFDKSYRGVKKSNLVNSTNKKDCVVTIEFSSGNTQYKIVRGIKPNVFQIFRNDKLIDEDAAVRDYQNYLETQILNFNFKAFTQTCLLGTANYIPFMQLPAAHRREVIETLFGINVFSTMNKLLKQKISDWKKSVDDLKRSIAETETQINMRKEFLQTLSNADDEQVKSINDRIAEIKVLITEEQTKKKAVIDQLLINTTFKTTDEYVQYFNDEKSRLTDDLRKFTQEQNNHLREADRHEDTASQLIENSGAECPSCYQTMTEETCTHTANIFKEKSEVERNLAAQFNKTIAATKGKISTIDQHINDTRSVLMTIDTIDGKIKTHAAVGKQLVADLKRATAQLNAENKTEEEKQKIVTLTAECDLLKRQYNKLVDNEPVYKTAISLLKDSGIKARIISQYLPILNQRVNYYLSLLNFSVKFELDENFNETLKSRNRTDFTYANFSMGERQRIDLAMMFAWRDLASMKNSVNCNILILDETFDSSLDGQGTDDLFSIIESVSEKTNIFVVSHKANLEDRFISVIRLHKSNGFTKIAA